MAGMAVTRKRRRLFVAAIIIATVTGAWRLCRLKIDPRLVGTWVVTYPFMGTSSPGGILTLKSDGTIDSSQFNGRFKPTTWSVSGSRLTLGGHLPALSSFAPIIRDKLLELSGNSAMGHAQEYEIDSVAVDQIEIAELRQGYTNAIVWMRQARRLGQSAK